MPDYLDQLGSNLHPFFNPEALLKDTDTQHQLEHDMWHPRGATTLSVWLNQLITTKITIATITLPQKAQCSFPCLYVGYSKHQPRGPMLSISRFVHTCVCLCVCVCVCVCSLLRYRLNVFLPPFPKVGCLKFLEIWNPWGKIMQKSGLRFEDFC